MLSNVALNEVMLQLSADYSLRESRIRASWALIARMYAVDMQCWHPRAGTVGMRGHRVRLGGLDTAGIASAARGLNGPGAHGRARVSGRLPGLHTGPSPPAEVVPALRRR